MPILSRPSPSRSLLAWLVLPLGMAVSLGGCARAGETSSGMLCEPTSYVFCRCADGSSGTKRCSNDGYSFDECDSCAGADPVVPPGPAPGSPNGGAGAGSPNGGAGAGSPVASKGLLERCSTDSECFSGWCESEYCTTPCKKVSDCPYPESECVLTGDAAKAHCMPSCQTAVDCKLYGTPVSKCGHATAIDSFSVRSCAHWGSGHQVVPYGSSCTPLKHSACNLGYDGQEIVCTGHGICAKGCFVDKDCPGKTTCSAQGELGTCK